MKYSVTVINNYLYNIRVSASTADIYKNETVAPNTQHTFENLGSDDSIVLSVTGVGEINFLSLGTDEIPGDYPITGTYGILVRSQNVEGYYRFNDDNGALTIEIDKFGTTTLSVGSGELIPVSMPEVIVTPTNVPA